MMQPGSDLAPQSSAVTAAGFQLRPYQQQALTAITTDLTRHRSTLLVLATGGGKTEVFAEVAKLTQQSGQRVLVLAHRDELLKQAGRKLESRGLWPDIEKGKRRASSLSKVVVASVQSLRGSRLTRWARDHFGLIIVDEAHRSAAASYRAVFDHFEAKLLGVTATPDRADGAPLGEIFETVAFRYDLRQAIADRYLVPIVARRILLDGVDLSTVKTRAGDFAQDELAAVMETEQALRGVVVPLLEQARERRTIVFGVDVAHAHALANMLNEYRPGCALAVDGGTGEDDRERALQRFATGEFQFLVNCALFTEGFDEPSISCVAVARPTKSRALFVQMAGRGTRLCPWIGKRDMLLLDFAGNVGKHRLAGPVDCLVGNDNVADDVRDEIDRLLGTAQLELEVVIAAADDEVSKRRAALAISAVVRYRSENIDPFLGAEDPRDVEQVPSHWDRQKPTERQLAALDKAGVTMSKLPATFSQADASRLLGRFAQRYKNGLCSFAAARKLSQSGVRDTTSLSRERANELLQQLRHGNWRPSAIASEPETSPSAVKERA